MMSKALETVSTQNSNERDCAVIREAAARVAAWPEWKRQMYRDFEKWTKGKPAS